MPTRYFIFLLSILLAVVSCGDTRVKKDELPPAGDPKTDTLQMTASASEMNRSTPYFRASGNEPAWILELFEAQIQLRVEGDTITTPHSNPDRAQDANIKRYALETERVRLTIEIRQEACMETAPGDAAAPYSVTIAYKEGVDTGFTHLEGCGDYILDYRLHDIWVLDTLKGQPVTADAFGRSLPSLEINASDKVFFGTTGCNRMRGQLFGEKELLRFTQIATTKMLCRPDGGMEQEFLQALESSTGYAIEDNRLRLFNPEGRLLVFKKAD